MPQTPLPDGEPVVLRDRDIRWVEPAGALPRLIEPTAAPALPNPAAGPAQRRAAAHWGQMRLVEFAGGPEPRRMRLTEPLRPVAMPVPLPAPRPVATPAPRPVATPAPRPVARAAPPAATIAPRWVAPVAAPLAPLAPRPAAQPVPPMAMLAPRPAARSVPPAVAIPSPTATVAPPPTVAPPRLAAQAVAPLATIASRRVVWAAPPVTTAVPTEDESRLEVWAGPAAAVRDAPPHHNAAPPRNISPPSLFIDPLFIDPLDAPLSGARRDTPTAPRKQPARRKQANSGAVLGAALLQRGVQHTADIATWVGQLVADGVPRLARLGAASVALGVIAFFAYEGGEHLAELAGASTRPDTATPDRQAAGLSLPDTRQEAAVPANPTQRAAYYLNRAKAGDPVAQYNIAVLYARGEGLSQNFATAAAWFRKAAASGNVTAQFNLGVIYERGLGVPANGDEAILWYRRAAEHNYAAAQYNLAIAYAEGRGTPQDRVAAARWYHQAAVQGLVPAMVNFAILYEKGEGVERSLTDAYGWYRVAAQRGDTVAEKRAGELLQQFIASDRRQAEGLATAIGNSIWQRPGDSGHAAAGAEGAESGTVLKSGNWVVRPVRYER